MSTITPFDPVCFEYLQERLQHYFQLELINEMCAVGQVKKHPADDELIDIGDQLTRIPLVLSGSIKIMTQDAQGDELLLYYLEFGDSCAVTMNCCSAKSVSKVRAITEVPTEILYVPSQKMDDWMVRYRSWRSYVLESYQSRLNEMVTAIDSIVFDSLESRLAKYLRDKAWMVKSAELIISHHDIAQDLHSSRVVISRLMKKLEKEHIIKQYRNKVVVLEFAKE